MGIFENYIGNIWKLYWEWGDFGRFDNIIFFWEIILRFGNFRRCFKIIIFLRKWVYL